MSLNLTTIQDALYTWVTTETGASAVWEFQNGIIPNKPFYALRVSNFAQIGDSQFIKPEAPFTVGDFDIHTNVDFTLEVLGFGPGVVQSTINLKMSLNNPTVHTTLKDSGVITWNTENPVQDISGQDNAENEERSVYEVNLRTCSIITDVTLGAIEKANIVGTTANPAQTININVDSTI